MRIYCVSDIHLELTEGWDLPDPLPEFDVMVIAGDLCPHMEKGVAWLRDRIEDKDVVYIPGNHESYGADIDVTVGKAKAAARDTRIHVLQNDTITIGGAGDVTFIGATLWTDFALLSPPDYAMAVADEFMNDYRRIRTVEYSRRLRPSDTLARHVQSRSFIENELAKPADGRKRVVVTHHGVHSQAIRPGMERDLLSSAYTSAMEKFVAQCGADLWVYGHTHYFDDRTIGRTRVVSNGKGYGPSRVRTTFDNLRFDPNFVVEI